MIEILIATALIGLLAMLLVTVMQNAQNGQNNLTIRDAARDLGNEIRTMADQNENCSILALASGGTIPVSAPSWPATQTYPIRIQDRFVDLADGTKFGQITIEKLEISPVFNPVTQTESYVPVPSNETLSTALQIKAHIRVSVKSNLSGTIAALRPIAVPAIFTLSPTRDRIIACDTALEAVQYENFCRSVGGDWDAETSKCTLPCPTGMTRIGENCEVPEESGRIDCEMIDNCGVHPRFIVN